MKSSVSGAGNMVALAVRADSRAKSPLPPSAMAQMIDLTARSA